MRVELYFTTNKELAFKPYTFWEAAHTPVHVSQYDKVYEIELPNDEATKHDIFWGLLSNNPPEDYRNRPPRVSDVIVCTQEDGTRSIHFCDSIGYWSFTDVPDFFQEMPKDEPAPEEETAPATLKRADKEFVEAVKANPMVAGMAFAHLLSKGSEQILDTAEEEYSAAIDAAIRAAEAKGGTYFMSKRLAMEMFHMAKRMAEMEAPTLAAVLGNACYQSLYAGIECGNFQADPAVVVCPNCGCTYFETGYGEDGELTCGQCHKSFRPVKGWLENTKLHGTLTEVVGEGK